MIAAMQMHDTNAFTQKDLLHHLLQATQHAATREELQGVRADLKADILAVKAEIVADMDRRFEQVGKRFDGLKADIKEQGRRHDRLSWAIFAGMLAIFFKDHLTKLLT